jgi:hypothetical protein
MENKANTGVGPRPGDRSPSRPPVVQKPKK